MKTHPLLKFLIALFAVAALASPSLANEGKVPKGVPHLKHVFFIMMENHGYTQIVGNPNAPFINDYMKHANVATNYYGIGHPSSTNYLEAVGGSNFGIRSDNPPDWHDMTCTPNLMSGFTTTDYPSSPNVCPIYGTGTDAATPSLDLTNECPSPDTTDPCPPGLVDLKGSLMIPAEQDISGKTIADQLAENGGTWKSYQESLPAAGADNVDYSDGFFTNTSNIPSVLSGETQTLIDLYAAKHDPFVYFQSVQEGYNKGATLKNIVGFEGKGGLFDDLRSGNVPDFSFIAPNQCNDQHGRGNAGPQCDYDPSDVGTQAGLNPALIYLGDLAVKNIVDAIHNSPAWRDGPAAIVLTWDENDYSFSPNDNRVLTIVDTNYGPHGLTSSQFYTHFSLLKTIEGALSLPCLNHACDQNVNAMTDLFVRGGHGDNN
jgi:phosphatidylinositol-3-phosphatase